MVTFNSIEQQIVTEYGWLVGNIKIYAVPFTFGALIVGWAIGHFI